MAKSQPMNPSKKLQWISIIGFQNSWRIGQLSASPRRDGLEHAKIDLVGDGLRGAVGPDKLGHAGMVAPEVVVVVSIGQSGRKTKLRGHKIVAVTGAIGVAGPAVRPAV